VGRKEKPERKKGKGKPWEMKCGLAAVFGAWILIILANNF